MERTEKQGLFFLILFVSIVSGGWFTLSYVCAYFEAQAYEHVTGKKVSTWDAMFIDLRIQEPVQSEQQKSSTH